MAMSITSGITTVEFNVHSDTSWVTTIDSTPHRIMYSQRTVIQTNRYGKYSRVLSGYLANTSQRTNLITFLKAHSTSLTFTDDQGNISSNVYMKSLSLKRIADITNWERHEYTMMLLS